MKPLQIVPRIAFTGVKMKQTFRELKDKILALLSRDDFDQALQEICRIPEQLAVSPLFSFFHSGNELIRWRAITAMGAVVAQLADSDREAARVIMRRLMWNLNDESGGIGWSSPEAMGEIMARDEQLAQEYHLILVSYMDEEGNYIEFEPLQRGVIWAVGRLSHRRPELLSPFAYLLAPYMSSADPNLRGLAAWAAIPMNTNPIRADLEPLLSDNTSITIFINGKLQKQEINQLAYQALSDLT